MANHGIFLGAGAGVLVSAAEVASSGQPLVSVVLLVARSPDRQDRNRRAVVDRRAVVFIAPKLSGERHPQRWITADFTYLVTKIDFTHHDCGSTERPQSRLMRRASGRHVDSFATPNAHQGPQARTTLQRTGTEKNANLLLATPVLAGREDSGAPEAFPLLGGEAFMGKRLVEPMLDQLLGEWLETLLDEWGHLVIQKPRRVIAPYRMSNEIRAELIFEIGIKKGFGKRTNVGLSPISHDSRPCRGVVEFHKPMLGLSPDMWGAEIGKGTTLLVEERRIESLPIEDERTNIRWRERRTTA